MVSRMGRTLLPMAGLGLALGSACTSPEIQANRLLLEAERQIRIGEPAAALEALDGIGDLEADHDLELPAVFWFRHAQLAWETGHEEAFASIIRYRQLVIEYEYTASRGNIEVLDEAERLAERWLADGAFRDCAACPLMVEVPAGSFLMGSPASEQGRDDSEGPQRRVTIDAPFAAGVFEVTYDEWEACWLGGGCSFVWDRDAPRGTRPVRNVAWGQAREYVRWLSQETGQEYRLLSEAEWEYVARSGTETARYWGQRADAQCRHANGMDAFYYERQLETNPAYEPSWSWASCSDGFERAAPVGLYRPTAFGLHDVLGNVREWTADCWNDSYEGAPEDGSARRSGDCSRHVVRGGSWFDSPDELRSAHRSWSPAAYQAAIGFRVARAIN